MIPNTNPNIVAHYRDNDDHWTLPVLAFNEDGEPLVMDEERGHLACAGRMKHFAVVGDGVSHSDTPLSFTPVPPGLMVTVRQRFKDVDVRPDDYAVHGWFLLVGGTAVPAVISPESPRPELLPLVRDSNGPFGDFHCWELSTRRR